MSIVRRALAFVLAAGCASLALASTPVCGPINANTTWDISGSPYRITCDVVVMPGATLTIDPNVFVEFDPNVKLRTQGGQIVALSSPGNEIFFLSADQSNPGYGVQINPAGVTGGLFTSCVFRGLNYGIFINCCGGVTPIVVNDCEFRGCITGIGGYSGVDALINNSRFNSNTIATDSADKIFEDCVFQGNQTNSFSLERTTFRRCTINGGINGIVGSGNAYNLFVYDTTITGTQIAVYSPTVMERCTITGNDVGLRFATPPSSVQCNDIFSNTTWNAEVLSGTTVTFANNWWGTTTTSSIDAGIKDGFDQVGLGFLQYTPILTAQYATGPCNCVLPVAGPSTPFTATNYSGSSVSFNVSPMGTPPFTYQWYRNNVPLNNTGRISGVNSQTLTISPIYKSGGDPTWTDAGQYYCRVTNLCGSDNSVAAQLNVNNCIADANGNSTVELQDIFDFLNAWFAGCP